MGRKQVPGLIIRAGIWHIDKRICGRRVCQSTGSDNIEEAEMMLAKVMEETRLASIYGVRPSRTFDVAAARFVRENQHKWSLHDDIGRLKGLMPWIGDIAIDRIHMGTLQPWIDHRRREGRAAGTINHGLQIVRRILNLAAGEWMDEHGLTWLDRPPKIKLLPNRHKRQPYPLSWDEQMLLFRALPDHLEEMALFAVNSGCRDGEICNLQWEWEVKVHALDTSVFIIPGSHTKNGDSRLVVLNRIAKSVVEVRREVHPTHVFSYKDHPMQKMLNTGWKCARKKVGLPHVRVHDLKHTYGRRLRAAGVSFEDRQDLLGHRSGRITTHYSAVELSNLIEASNRVCGRHGRRPELVVLNGKFRVTPAKLPQNPQKQPIGERRP